MNSKPTPDHQGETPSQQATDAPCSKEHPSRQVPPAHIIQSAIDSATAALRKEREKWEELATWMLHCIPPPEDHDRSAGEMVPEALARERFGAYINKAEKYEETIESLRAERDRYKAALETILRRVPIMASTGDYRMGQLHALEVCAEAVAAALNPPQ
jgi:hypothetical protein